MASQGQKGSKRFYILPLFGFLLQNAFQWQTIMIYMSSFYFWHHSVAQHEATSILIRHHTSLQWRHNGCDGVSIHLHDCLLNRLFRRRWKKTWKLRVTGLCAGNSPVTGEFPAKMASNAENVSIGWRLHVGGGGGGRKTFTTRNSESS